MKRKERAIGAGEFVAARGFNGARAARADAAGHGRPEQGPGVIGREEGARGGERVEQGLIKGFFCVDQNGIRAGSEFGGQCGQATDAQLNFRIEGVQRIGADEEDGGGAPAVDSAGGKGQQHGGIMVGEEEEARARRQVGNGESGGADHVHRNSRREESQSRVVGGEFDGKSRFGNEDGEKCLTQVGVVRGREAREEELAGREDEIARELRADALADEFDALAVGEGLAHEMIISQYPILNTQHAARNRAIAYEISWRKRG